MGAACTSSPTETATPLAATELEGSPNPSVIQTFASMPDDNRTTIPEAAKILGWEPLMPEPEKYRLQGDDVILTSYLREGVVLASHHSTQTGTVFELRQAQHPFRSVPSRPEDYLDRQAGSFRTRVWADEYQSFAEVTRIPDAQWQGFVVANTPNLLELVEFVGSLR
jgi:hypothetical protein